MVLTLQHDQALARPRDLSLQHQKLMSWNHFIYHLILRVLLYLISMGFLPKWLLEFQNKPQLCVACQYSAAHCCPWQTEGNKIGLVHIPDQTNPVYGILVDQIVSTQPVIIPKISGILTSHRFWGCTTFMDHVSHYVYFHPMRELSLSETLLAKDALNN